MKKWFYFTLFGIVFWMAIVGGITLYVDPLFHFHAPISNLEFPIQDFQQRYICDGMARNFDYDALIVGTSMTENFKPSELDELFGVNSLKLSVSGASFREVDMTLKQALSSNNDVKIVVRGLDLNSFPRDKDYVEDIGQMYLLNDKHVDDVNYLFNKSIFNKYVVATLEYTQNGNKTPSRDEMFNWMKGQKFGRDIVLNSYELEKSKLIREFSTDEFQNVSANISQNIIEAVEENSGTCFYLFFPPYSICEWDVKNSDGGIEYWIDLQKCAIEQILQYDNVKLFSFDDNFDLVCNLDNYKDRGHYGEWVNSYILESMKNGEHQLKLDNYQDYIDRITDFYTKYDFASLHN